MKNSIINGLRIIYQATAPRVIRNFYFNCFCALVRNKKTRSSIGGITYDLDLGEMIDLCLLLKQYETDVKRAIIKYCKPGMTVLDIGANIGAHTLFIAKTAGIDGRVFAFEPAAYAFEKLIKNISLNPMLNIKAFQVALSDHDEKSRPIDFRSSWRTDGRRKDWPCQADFIRLDSWRQSQGVEKVDIIKLDVDGNERSVILGALSVLSAQRPLIFMEAWSKNLRDNAKNPFITLKQLGYRFFDIRTEEEYVSMDNLKEAVFANKSIQENSINIIARG